MSDGNSPADGTPNADPDSPVDGTSNSDGTIPADPAADRDAAETGSTSVVVPDDPDSKDRVREAVLDSVATPFADRSDEAYPGNPSEAFVREEFFDFGYLDDYEELERYWVNRPFAYVSVLYDEATNTNRYHVSEPALDEFEEYVRQDLIRSLRSDLMYKELDGDHDKAAVFDEEVPRVMREHAATVGDGSLQQIIYYLRRDFVSYGKIDPIMRDRAVEDVSCDGAEQPVFVYHHGYRDLRTNLSFGAERPNAYAVRLAQRAGKHLSVADPLVDASLPDGSRVRITLGGEVTTRGSNFTVRKFAEVPFTPVDLVNCGTFSVEQMAYLWLAVENNASLMFAGGTGSGKTTSLDAVSMFVPPESKVVSIEDTPELTPTTSPTSRGTRPPCPRPVDGDSSSRPGTDWTTPSAGSLSPGQSTVRGSSESSTRSPAVRDGRRSSTRRRTTSPPPGPSNPPFASVRGPRRQVAFDVVVTDPDGTGPGGSGDGGGPGGRSGRPGAGGN